MSELFVQSFFFYFSGICMMASIKEIFSLTSSSAYRLFKLSKHEDG